MAVYTTLSLAQVNEIISGFDLPPAVLHTPASSGVENTTYFITLVSSRQLVLTIFESIDASQLPFYIAFLSALDAQGLPVPSPLVDKSGNRLVNFAGKPALLFPRAPGNHRMEPGITECHLAGQVLAKIHLVGMQMNDAPPDPNDLAWMSNTFTFVEGILSAEDRKLLQQQLQLGNSLADAGLPAGIIHGDLFRDNVLFDHECISAVIDFYNAGLNMLLLDLAIAVNDWCYSRQIVVNGDNGSMARQSAMRDGYESIRPLQQVEADLWIPMLQFAAARLWLSRLDRVVQAGRGRARVLKDPAEYRSLLLLHK